MLSHFTNDLKSEKNKERRARKRMIEPPWIPPAMLPNRNQYGSFYDETFVVKGNRMDYVILQLHGRWLYGEPCAMRIMCCRII